MRTTIVIDDAVFRQARRRAEQLNTTFSGLVEDALRTTLQASLGQKAKRKAFKLVVNTGPGLAPGQSWETIARQVLGADRNGLP